VAVRLIASGYKGGHPYGIGSRTGAQSRRDDLIPSQRVRLSGDWRQGDRDSKEAVSGMLKSQLANR